MSVLKIYIYIYMKRYSLLILNENTNISSTNSKAPKNTKLVLFPSGIFPCKQIILHYSTFIPQIPTLSDCRIKNTSEDADVNLCANLRDWRGGGGIPAAPIVCPTLGGRHQHTCGPMLCKHSTILCFRCTNSLLGFSMDFYKC